MKANIKLIGLGLIGAMAFASCSEDFLDEKKNYDNVNADIYNDYEGVANLKTVNDNAGVAPVVVERPVIDLLLSCKEYYQLTGGKVNVAMGSVLKLWHDCRTDGLDNPAAATLPDGNVVRNVVLFAVLVYELVGPALTKRSLLAAGEIKPEGRTSARKLNEDIATKE